MHTGLQLHAVQACPAQSHANISPLIETAVDALKPFIHGLVMSRTEGDAEVPASVGVAPSEVDLVSGSETEAQTARLIDAQPGQPDTLVTVRLGYQQ